MTANKLFSEVRNNKLQLKMVPRDVAHSPALNIVYIEYIRCGREEFTNRSSANPCVNHDVM